MAVEDLDGDGDADVAVANLEGPLAEALAQPADFIAPRSLLPHRAGDFLLRVRGDSMIGDGIHDGDLVLLRPEVEVQPGEVAAVHTGDSYESTLKHVYFEQEGVRLRASNPAEVSSRLRA